MLAMSMKDDVIRNDFSRCDGSGREPQRDILWQIASDLSTKVDAIDMCIPARFIDAEHEDFLLLYQHNAAKRLVLLRGYVVKVGCD